MKILKNLMWAMACIVCFNLNANAQESTPQKHLTFNAVAANVDGLPKTVSAQILGIEIGFLTYDVNPDGEEGDGSTKIGTMFTQEPWHLISIAEDFNYHTELINAVKDQFIYIEDPNNYKRSIDGKISSLVDLPFETDGLGLLLAKSNNTGELDFKTSLSQPENVDEAIIPWSVSNGNVGEKGEHGYDALVTKGFRYYMATLAEKFVIDVYVLHMDAGDRGVEDAFIDRTTRNSQLTQLAEHILARNNNRPILIMGDTNCRYTREALKLNLIDKINNAGKGMTIKDPWVELVRGGEYPKENSESLMTDKLGSRAGEVVDKIFYINIDGAPLQITANAYERVMIHADYNKWTDHDPVICNFTLTYSEGTDTPGEQKWTVDAPTINETIIQGCTPEAGKSYYFKNVETKRYVKTGGTWGAHAVLGSAGTPITLYESGGKYRFCTVENTTLQMNPVADPYMNNEGTDYGWTFEVADAVNNHYYIKCDAGALTDGGSSSTYCSTFASTKSQQWILLDDAQMKTEIARSTSSFDCTPLLKTADFDAMEFEKITANGQTRFQKYWSGTDDWKIGYTMYPLSGTDNDIEFAISCIGSAANTLSQTLSGMPAGTYRLTYEAFYNSGTTTTPTIKFGNVSNNIAKNASFTYADDNGVRDEVARLFRDNDTYFGSISYTLDSDGAITVSVNKPKVNRGDSWVSLDNFKLHYEGGDDPTLEARKIVADKINETWLKVQELDENGQNAYDISLVIWRLNNGYVQNEQDAQILCGLIDEAYRIAVIVSQRIKIEEEYNKPNTDGTVEVTGLIYNPSFETGDYTHWTVARVGNETKVVDNSDGTYTANEADGGYIFNTYSGDNNSTASSVKQTIVDLKNGMYELKAKVTSFNGRTVFLVGNDSHVGVVAEDVNGVEAKKCFKEATLYFLVEDGTATIGAVGGSAMTESANAEDYCYYMPESGGFFKADDFRLTYVCDLPHGRLKFALDEAYEEKNKLDKYGLAEMAPLSSYECDYDKKTLETDGKATVVEIKGKVRNAVLNQKTKNTDFTYAITNPNFETKDWSGWTVTTHWDTKATNAADIARVGFDGSYLFNSWNQDANKVPSNDVMPISQTVTGLPKGKYRLTARMTSTVGNILIVSGNGTEGSVTSSTDNVSMDLVSTEFEVTDDEGTAKIMAGGANPTSGTLDETNGGYWYKVDDFRLTYLGRTAELDESTKDYIVDITNIDGQEYTDVTIKRPIPGGIWTTLAIPYAAAIPEGLTVYKFTGDSYDAATNTINFQLTEVTGNFEAHVPYMVKHEETNSVNLADLEVKDENGIYDVVKLDMNDQATVLTYTTIHSTYKGGYIPNGAYYIANNKYYRIPENYSKQIWATPYRIYIMLNSNVPAGAAIRYSMDGEDDGTTGIGDIVDAEVTVVAVYGADGRLLESPQRGVNILKMSDGTTQKVFVK